LYFLSFVVLGFELRASWLLVEALQLEPLPQPFYALVIFQIGFGVFAWGHPWIKDDHT
jgi:hypothetical protein